MNSVLVCPFFSRNIAAWMLAIGIAICLMTVVSNGQIEGFTEPYRRIDLATDESGPIAAMAVIEGQFVEANDVICELDKSLQEIQLELAKQRAESKGQIWTAQQSLQRREEIHKRIRRLQTTGNATESELLRSEMELAIAEGKVLIAEEEAAAREIEYREALLQLQRRTIRAPFAGVVSKIHRRRGEFVSTLQPEIITLMQIDKLLAKFNVPSSQAELFQPGAIFELTTATGESVSATVFRVAVFTDAQSGTVEIKLLIENDTLGIRSGEMLTLHI